MGFFNNLFNIPEGYPNTEIQQIKKNLIEKHPKWKDEGLYRNKINFIKTITYLS